MALVDHLRELRVEAECLDVVHLETGVPHTVALVQGHAVDFTYRQFHARGDVPLVLPLARFLAEFRCQ